MNRRIKGTIFILIICIQIILLGFSVGNVGAINNNSLEDHDKELTKNDGYSHSSPFYFPINGSSPLMTEDLSEGDSEDIPNLAYVESENENILTVNLDKYALTIGESLTINLKLTSNFTVVSGEPITIEIYQDYYRDYYYLYDPGTPIYIDTITTNSIGEASTSFSMTNNKGLYTIQALAEGCKTYKEFTVGEIGIFCKGPRYYQENQDYQAAIHVVNLSDFTGIPNAEFNHTISHYDYSDGSWSILNTNEGQTDDSGYALFNAEITFNQEDYHLLKLTICTLDGKAKYDTFLYESWDYYYYSLWGGEQETNQDQIQYVVTTDKTIYSPGEIMHLRVLVLEYSFMNETKRILQNSPVSLTIYNPNEFAIFWTTLTTDEYGILTFNFPLDEDCELGFYGFEFSQLDIEFRYNVKVDHYEKPVFRVDINTNGRNFYPINEKLFEGYVDVSYYFGQPVVGASVELSIMNYREEIKHAVQGFSNGEGRFYFSVKLNSIEDLEYTFSAKANVTDIYGRYASNKKTFTRIEEIFGYGYLTNWAPHPTDNLEYYFYVYQYIMAEDIYGYGYWNWHYNPLSNISVDIDVFGIEDYPIYSSISSDKDLLVSYTRFTNIFGSGKLEFNLPIDKIKLYNFFEIQLTVNLEDGRSTISSYYFRFKKYSLEIDILESSIDLGQTLEFNVTYKEVLTNSMYRGEGKIYLYDSHHQLIGKFSGIISGLKTFSISIPNFYPEGEYYIYSHVWSRSNQYYYGFNYHSAHVSFKVGSFQVLSFNTNFNNSGIYYDEIQVEIGDRIEINGFSNVSANLPHYLEVYKRGLIYSTPLEVIEDKFAYNLTAIAKYAPDFTIMVYAISDIGKLYESMVSVHVEYSYNVNISTDKEIYEPGDHVTLTITPSDNTTTMIALSFIDSSILDVEPEDDSELSYFHMNHYSTFISSGSSWGSGFDATTYWWYGYGDRIGGAYYYDLYQPFLRNDYATYGVGNLEDGGRSVPSFDELIDSFETEIRKNISESANWMPKLIISQPTNISFKLPDNIGEWTIRAVCNSLHEDSDNIMLWGDVVTKQIKTFLPFFIEFEISQPVFQDDILGVKAYIYNYIGTDIQATIAINAPNLIILNNEIQELYIPNDFVSEVEFSVYCIEPDQQNITILAATEVSGIKYSDAKQLTTYIKPNGIEVIDRTIGFLNTSNGSLLLNYSLDPLAIYHKETLALYTDLMDISIDSWQSLVGYPYGCIEQTISKALPTALIYNYLNQSGQLTSALEQEMTSMILEGLSRIYNFQQSDGGWGWWRSDNTKIIMTSIVVSALNQIEGAGFPVNSIILKKGIDYLLSHQNPNGAWDFQDYSSNTLECTAYVLKALLNYHNTSQITSAIINAVNRFKIVWNSGEMQSTYAASLFYIATLGTSYENSTFNGELIQFIKDSKKVEDSTVFWESDQSNNWYWRKLGNIVEITSYATWALALDDYINNYALIQKSVRYLVKQKNQWGWRTTADTAAAITALTAIKGIAKIMGFIDFNGTISIKINTNNTPQYLLNFTESENQPNEILLYLAEYINTSSNLINISLEGSGQICYIFESIQILRSNPKVEIPEIIEVSKDENFYLNIKFSDIDDRMPITDAVISVLNVLLNLQVPGVNYTIFTPIIINGTELIFSLKAPSLDGDYIIEGVSILGFIKYTLNNSSSYQLFQQTIGPIIIRVGLQSFSSESLNETIDSSKPKISSSLALKKHVSKQSFLMPGEIITIAINISNNGEPLQFLVLEDEIPTGTTFLSDSVEILGNYDTSEITHDLYTSAIHLFFPMLATGITEITYKLQVENVKNSYSGQCKLWGMYDDISISAQSVVIENVPRKRYTNNSIYLDLIEPIISNITINQNQENPEKKIFINFKATDDNGINRIRIIFSQNDGWRAQTLYSSKDQELYSIAITDIKNVDSKAKVYLEVSDIYGNVIASNLISVKIIVFEFVPYILIGIIVGFSVGLASIASILYKKHEEKRRYSPKSKLGETKPRPREVSFLDEDEEEL